MTYLTNNSRAWTAHEEMRCILAEEGGLNIPKKKSRSDPYPWPMDRTR